MAHSASTDAEPTVAVAIDDPGIEGGADLSRFQCEVIDIFVRVADLLGIPKSVGEIYGLLYASARPLAFQDIVERLGMSKGSASQGLRMLRATGAVRLVYVPGRRRDHFLPETELRALLSGFLKEKVQPHFESGALRIKSLQALVRSSSLAGKEGPEMALLRERVNKLGAWQKKGGAIIPLIAKFFG